MSVCVAWHTSGFSNFDDVLRRELLIGGTGPGDDTIQFGKVLVGVLGAKLKIISGYPGGKIFNKDAFTAAPFESLGNFSATRRRSHGGGSALPRRQT